MRRAVRLGMAVALWGLAVLLVSRAASGVGPSDFSGFELQAKGTAVQFVFNSPSLGVPATPTGELNGAYSEASLRSGPSAYGLASALWPGQVAAALPSFLQGEIESQSGQKLPFDLPNYPVRAETFYPQGPTSARQQLGTLLMASDAHSDVAEANSSLAAFDFPGIGHLGEQESQASSGFDPQGGVAMVEASASHISLFGGVVQIDAVTSTATARTDGLRATVAGSTTVTGASVGGHAVRIDGSGVHVEGQGTGTAAAQQAVNALLHQLGVSLEVATPVDTLQAGRAERALSGLLVTIDDRAIDALVSRLPPDLQRQIRGQVTFDQAFTIAIAPVVVAAGGARSVPLVFLPNEVGVATATGGPAGTVTLPPPERGSDLGTPAPEALAPSSGAFEPVSRPRPLSPFGGIPVALVVLAALAALAASGPLVAAAERALRPVDGACPFEEEGT